jgi:peptide/nickel transport system substrate-binding protein
MDFALSPLGEPKFPLGIMSATEKYLWEVSWGPEIIRTGTPTTFVMNMQNARNGDLVKFASFDFVLEKDGSEVYRQRLSSNIGTFTNMYTFTEQGTYRLAAENISGEQDSAEVDIVVLQGTGVPSPAQQQQPSGCLIATAAFGSELTPQVQFLRSFRDNYILQSESGSAFMNAFNAAYYSFSPTVADYEREQPWLQASVKTMLYPLFGILLTSGKVYGTASGGEGGTILAGAVTSALIGTVYISPAMAVAAIVLRKRISTRFLAIALVALAASLAATAIAIAIDFETLLSLATSLFVLSTVAASALGVVIAAGRLVSR